MAMAMVSVLILNVIAMVSVLILNVISLGLLNFNLFSMSRSRERRSPSLRSTISARAQRLRNNVEARRSRRRRSHSNVGPINSRARNATSSIESTSS